MREKNVRIGDMLVPGPPRARTNKSAILIKQTKKYWYLLQNTTTTRTRKDKLWRLIDTGKIKVLETRTKMRKSQRKDRTLDLHGVRHAKADDKIRKFLNFIELPCTVITGDSLRMKTIVEKIVKEYGWIMAQHPVNWGEVIIREKE